MKENDDEEITEIVVEHSSEEKAETTAEVAGKVVFCSGSVENVYEAEVPVAHNKEEIERSDGDRVLERCVKKVLFV